MLDDLLHEAMKIGKEIVKLRRECVRNINEYELRYLKLKNLYKKFYRIAC